MGWSEEFGRLKGNDSPGTIATTEIFSPKEMMGELEDFNDDMILAPKDTLTELEHYKSICVGLGKATDEVSIALVSAKEV